MRSIKKPEQRAWRGRESWFWFGLFSAKDGYEACLLNPGANRIAVIIILNSIKQIGNYWDSFLKAHSTNSILLNLIKFN